MTMPESDATILEETSSYIEKMEAVEQAWYF